jgi:hypothetical protein
MYKESLSSYYTNLPDPRIDRCKEHLPEDIIFITIAAVICGAETWNEIEDYGKSKESQASSKSTLSRRYTLS